MLVYIDVRKRSFWTMSLKLEYLEYSDIKSVCIGQRIVVASLLEKWHERSFFIAFFYKGMARVVVPINEEGYIDYW